MRRFFQNSPWYSTSPSALYLLGTAIQMLFRPLPLFTQPPVPRHVRLRRIKVCRLLLPCAPCLELALRLPGLSLGLHRLLLRWAQQQLLGLGQGEMVPPVPQRESPLLFLILQGCLQVLWLLLEHHGYRRPHSLHLHLQGQVLMPRPRRPGRNDQMVTKQSRKEIYQHALL
jgi:hypothetical protein